MRTPTSLAIQLKVVMVVTEYSRSNQAIQLHTIIHRGKIVIGGEHYHGTSNRKIIIGGKLQTQAQK